MTMKASRSSAFTLVEIMVALVVFSMLIAALYSTWIFVVRATSVGKGAAAQLQRERVAMRTIEDGLNCIQSHQASIEYYLFFVQNGDQPFLSFTAYVPDSFPRSGEFLGMTPKGVPMDYHLRRLTFDLESGQNYGQKELVLRQSPILMAMTPSEQNTPLVLARNVTDFLIECWDTNEMTWDTEWDSTNMLPPLVRVTLGFGSENAGGAQVITRELSFPSGTMPASVQLPGAGGPFQGGLGNFFNNNNNNNNNGNSGQGLPNPASYYTPGSPTSTLPGPRR